MKETCVNCENLSTCVQDSIEVPTVCIYRPVSIRTWAARKQYAEVFEKEALDKILQVFEHGATKHAEVQDVETQLRHALSHWYRRGENEEESRIPHLAHVAARLLLALYKLSEEEI